MLKMSRLTDYGTGVLAYLAQAGARPHSASEVAEHTGLPAATVSKVLKLLSRSGLVSSHRGAQGGYSLARPATDITAAEVIDALEGPVAITECSVEDGSCELEALCLVGTAWQRINVAIRHALDGISLAELIRMHPGRRLQVDLRAMVTTPGKLARLERG
ncbi:MAG: SUF system Fe-S cluster assembly regulator [Candidatus Loosdrechtia sp.]|uniref:SUF system Fe-S cluster assembly regulator n=1 Tax=Candidatus Loosdrechtia sp. TaxID=3101272 RepID=UPI00403AAE9C